MNKILVIEDWEELEKELQGYATSRTLHGESKPDPDGYLYPKIILEVLKYHELDVIELKAEVSLINSDGMIESPKHKAVLVNSRQDLNPGDEVLVIRKEKA